MARIKMLQREEMNEEQKKQFDEFPANLAKGLLLTKTLAKGYAALGTALRYTEFPAKERELVIVRVGEFSNCRYELMQHRELALAAGWTEEDLYAVKINKLEHFNERIQAILKFTNECMELVKVNTETFYNVRKFLSEAEIAELTLLIGHYMMTARFIETLEIDLDDKPTSWENVKLSNQ